MRRACRTTVHDDALRAAAEFQRKASRMRADREGAARHAAAIDQRHGLSGGHAVIARVPGIGERLTAHFVARQERGDHAWVALHSAVEQRQRTVAVAEEAYHRGDAIMGAAD